MSHYRFAVKLVCMAFSLVPALAQAGAGDLIASKQDSSYGNLRLQRQVEHEFDSSANGQRDVELPEGSLWILSNDKVPTTGRYVILEIRQFAEEGAETSQVLWRKRGHEYSSASVLVQHTELRVHDFAVISNSMYVVYSNGPLMCDQVALAGGGPVATNSWVLRKVWSFHHGNTKIAIRVEDNEVVAAIGGEATHHTVLIPLRSGSPVQLLTLPEDLARSKQPAVVTALSADLFVDEPIRSRLVGGDVRLTPRSVSAMHIMNRILVDSDQFPEEVNAWARSLNGVKVEKRRELLRSWWNVNQEAMRSGRYLSTRPLSGAEQSLQSTDLQQLGPVRRID